MTTSKLVPILSRIAVVCLLTTTLSCGGGGGPGGTGNDGGASAEGGAASGDLSSGKKDQAPPAIDSAADARGAGDAGTLEAGGAHDLGTVDAGSARDLGTVDVTSMEDAPAIADALAPIDVAATVDLNTRADVAALADVAVPTDAPMLALGQVKIGPNGQVTVSYSNGSASTSAWIGLYASGAADGAYIGYQYTPGTTSGTLTFTVPESSGQYDLRLFADGGYAKIATSPTFTVSYPYDLDPGFGTGGRLSFDFLGNSLVDAICSVIPLSSGKILLVGTAKTGNKNGSGWEQNEFALAQLNADGTFDTTFGQSGRAHAGTTTVSLAGCAAAAVQSDGKIVVAGWGESTTSGADYALARFTSVGALDATFGTAGFTTTNFKASATSVGEDDKILSLAILTDGRILAGGEMLINGPYTNGRASFARYLSTGALDTTFAGTGIMTLDLSTLLPPGGGSLFDATSLVVTSTGAFFAGITSISTFGRNDTAIASVKADGTLDTTFGTSGVLWETKPGVHNDQHLSQLALTSAGSLIMLGHDTWSWFLGRYTSAGAADKAFGSAGQAVGDLSDSWDLPAGMVQMTDGTTLIGISPDSANGASMSGNLGLVRHDALGNLDTTFGRMRWKWTVGTTALASRATSFAMQADGKLLLGGLIENPGGNQDFAVMRLVRSAGW
ncbi:MAG TPA: hypothetical protein VF550_10470 [Polyangia bacterium]